MPLNKDTLGLALYNKRQQFSNKTVEQLVEQFGSFDNAVLAACKADAEAIIDHFKNNANLNVPGTGLQSPAGPVTGNSVTGTIN